MGGMWTLIQSTALICCLAQSSEQSKPLCNAQNQGRIWPERSQRDPCRPLEMCTLHVWKYRWTAVTMPVSQLSKDPKARAACESRRAATASGPASHGILPRGQ